MPGGIITAAIQQALNSESEWDSLNWRDKPSWNKLQGVVVQIEATAAHATFRAAARAETQRRICEVYGAQSIEDEILIRLRGGLRHTQDERRDEIRARYRRLLYETETPWTEIFSPEMLD